MTGTRDGRLSFNSLSTFSTAFFSAFPVLSKDSFQKMATCFVIFMEIARFFNFKTKNREKNKLKLLPDPSFTLVQ